MDGVGLYVIGDAGRMEGVTLGLPDEFNRLYFRHGVQIDPVLARVRETGSPSSTRMTLGDRWTSCELYRRVSGRFGLKGFATIPLYDARHLTGMLFLGALDGGKIGRLDAEELCTLMPHAMRLAVRLARLPKRHPRLTRRQNEVAEAASRGLTNREIAEEIGSGSAAVHKHMKELNRLFGTHTRTAMTAAWRAGLPS